MLKGMKMRWKERFERRPWRLWESGVLGSEEDAEGGVGGAAGMKKEGIDATEDCRGVNMLSSRKSKSFECRDNLQLLPHRALCWVSEMVL